MEASITGRGRILARVKRKRDHGPLNSCRHRHAFLYRKVRIADDLTIPEFGLPAAEDARQVPEEANRKLSQRTTRLDRRRRVKRNL
jgi:hypothetical protein